VYAWAARVAVHRGDLGAAREHLTRAARLRPLLTYALPVVSVQALLELARAYIALADPHGARAVLGQADDILQQRPDLGVLAQQADQLRAQVDTLRADVLGASSLTTAKLRLLPLLSTHLSFREIGERLYLSPHTVKSQAMSLYHKLVAEPGGPAHAAARPAHRLAHTPAACRPNRPAGRPGQGRSQSLLVGDAVVAACLAGPRSTSVSPRSGAGRWCSVTATSSPSARTTKSRS
jgi:LuxR family maltose regulon positive regulatory protein